jgi:hypothetical protein
MNQERVPATPKKGGMNSLSSTFLYLFFFFLKLLIENQKNKDQWDPLPCQGELNKRYDTITLLYN